MPVSGTVCLAVMLPDPNASDLRPIFSFSPLVVTWTLLHKLQSGVNEKSSLPNFHRDLCHLRTEFSSVTFLLPWEKENRLFRICPVVDCCALDSVKQVSLTARGLALHIWISERTYLGNMVVFQVTGLIPSVSPHLDPHPLCRRQSHGVSYTLG